MNSIRRLSCFAAVAASAFVGVACEHTDSRFASTSQSNMIVDTTEPAGGRTKPGYEAVGEPEGIALVRGRYYYVRNGEGTLLTNRQRFVEGATFDPSGRIMLSNGSLVKLANGDMVTFSGDRVPVPPSTRLP
jgi:hypothetical protein